MLHADWLIIYSTIIIFFYKSVLMVLPSFLRYSLLVVESLHDVVEFGQAVLQVDDLWHGDIVFAFVDLIQEIDSLV